MNAQDRDEVRRAFMYSRLYEAEARRRATFLRTLDFPAVFLTGTALRFAPKGDALAVGAADGDLTVCHTDPAAPLVMLRRSRPRGHRILVAWSPDARILAEVTDEAVLLWDVEEVRVIGEIGKSEHPTCAAFSPDGRTIAVGDVSGHIRIWSRASLEPEGEAVEISSRRIQAIAWSPDNRHVAVVGTEPFVWVHDCKELRMAWSRELPIWGIGVSYSPDGNTLAAAVLDNAVWLFDSNSGERIARYPTGTQPRGIVWSPDGKWLLHSGQGGTMVDVADGRTLDVARNPRAGHHAVTLSADGSGIAARTSDAPGVRLFRVGDAGLTLRFPGHRRFMSGIAMSGDGRIVVTAGPYDGLTRVWTMPESCIREADLSRATVREFEGGPDAASKPYHVQLSPDGTLLATASLYGRTELRSLSEGKLLHVIQEASNTQTYGAWHIAFSPDGQWLFSADAGGRILRWSIADQVFESPLVGGGGQVYGLACSGDGRSLAAGSADGVVRVWDLADLSAAPRTLRGHDGLVSGMSFSPTGGQLASSGRDATIRVWDLQTGQEVARRRHDLWVNGVVYSPDGRFLLSCSDDNTARLWSTTDYRLLQVFQSVDQVHKAVFTADSRYFYMNDGTDLARHRIVVDDRIEDPVRLLHEAERAAGMRLEGLQLVSIR
jgi:WD40 repeat protein